MRGGGDDGGGLIMISRVFGALIECVSSIRDSPVLSYWN